jgi:hypothetical protein
MLDYLGLSWIKLDALAENTRNRLDYPGLSWICLDYVGRTMYIAERWSKIASALLQTQDWVGRAPCGPSRPLCQRTTLPTQIYGSRANCCIKATDMQH